MEPIEIIALVSGLSFLMAGLSLGWNIYRDVILKPRLKIVFGVFSLVGGGVPKQTYLMVKATNHGPGAIKVINIIGRIQNWWERLLGRGTFFIVIPDESKPEFGRLLTRLEVGDELNFYLPYTNAPESCLLQSPFTKIGLSDNFDKCHWASKKDIKKAKEQFKKDFPPEE